jgi:hypothetical protein
MENQKKKELFNLIRYNITNIKDYNNIITSFIEDKYVVFLEKVNKYLIEKLNKQDKSIYQFSKEFYIELDKMNVIVEDLRNDGNIYINLINLLENENKKLKNDFNKIHIKNYQQM